MNMISYEEIEKNGKSKIFFRENKLKRIVQFDSLLEMNKFLQEILPIFKISQQNIVKPKTFFVQELNEKKFIISVEFEKCDGNTLFEYIQHKRNKKEKIKLQVVIEFTLQLIEAIQHLHGLGIMHQNLKSHNIFVVNTKGNDGEELKEIRVGNIFLSNETDTKVSSEIELWEIPEIKRGENYSFKSDYWGIYCLILDMLLQKSINFAYELKNHKENVFSIIKERYPKHESLTKFLCKVIEIDRSKRMPLDDFRIELIQFSKDVETDSMHSTKSYVKEDAEPGNCFHLRKQLKAKDEEIFFLKQELNKLQANQVKTKKKMKKIKTFTKKQITIDQESMKKDNYFEKYQGKIFIDKKTKVVVLSKTGKKESSLEEFKKNIFFKEQSIDEENFPNLEKFYGFYVWKKEFFIVSKFHGETKLFSVLMDKRKIINQKEKYQHCLDIITLVYKLYEMQLFHANLDTKSMILDSNQRIVVKRQNFIRRIKNLKQFDFSDSKRKMCRQLYISFYEIFFRTVYDVDHDLFNNHKLKPQNKGEEKFFEILEMLNNQDQYETLSIRTIFYFLGDLVNKYDKFKEIEERISVKQLPFHISLKILEFYEFIYTKNSTKFDLLGKFKKDYSSKVFVIFKYLKIDGSSKKIPKIRQLQGLETNWQYISKEMLRLSHSSLNSIGFVQLDIERLNLLNTKTIKKIKTEMNLIDDAFVNTINKFNKLEHLYLANKREDDLKPLKTDLNCSNLKSLELYQSLVPSFTFKKLPFLTKLSIHYCTVQEHQILEISKSKTIQILEIKYCLIGSPSIKKIFENSIVKNIDLYRSYFDFKELKNINFPDKSKIETLRFFLCNSMPVEFFSKIGNLQNLKKLSVKNNNLEKAHVMEILTNKSNWRNKVIVDISKNFKINRSDFSKLMLDKKKNLKIIPLYTPKRV